MDRVPGGETLLTVVAEGYAPALPRITADASREPVTVRLAPPRLFRVKVVDRQGQPIPGVVLQDPRCRDAYTLDARLVTDEQGVAEWYGPDAAVDFSPRASGYRVLRSSEHGVRLEPVGEDRAPQVVTAARLFPALELTVLARDARSGEPVEDFHISLNRIDTRKDPRWRSWNNPNRRPVEVGPGEKNLPLSASTEPTVQVRVEAPGYAAWESPVYDRDDQNLRVVADARVRTVVRGTGCR